MDEYAMYLRKSRADIELEKIEKMETLKRHRKILSELAKKQHLHVTDIYEELVSGESIADRPEVQRLLDNVYKKKYKGVLVVEVERLARGNTRDQGEVAEAFKYSNTLIVTPSKTYDPNNEFDEEYFEFGLFMSRREYKTIRRRLQTGILESVKDGCYVGSVAPYGYDKFYPDRKTKTLKPNESAQYVKLMFSWFVDERLSCGQIAKRLTAMGVPTLSGKPEWNRATIKDILQNVTYTGKVRWNRRKCSKEYDGEKLAKRKRRLTPDDFLIADGKHEAIIPMEVFEKAQTLFTGSVPVNTDGVVVNPLAGLLFCKRCGRAVSYQGYNHRPGTAPRFIHRESNVCKVKSMRADEVMAALVSGLESAVQDMEIKVSSGSGAPPVSVVDSIEKELASAVVRRDEIMDYFERKIYTLEEFLERREKINGKIKQLNVQLSEEKAKASAPLAYEERITTLKEVIRSLSDPEVEAKEKNDFLKEIVQKIEYDVDDLGRQHGGVISLDIHFK